jgi:hypothetical protein
LELSGADPDLVLSPFGLTNDQPVVGNWTGVGGFLGTAKVGVFRPGTLTWYLDSGNGLYVSPTEEQQLGPFRQNGDVPVRWNISTVKAN